jgi:hypothetical protein
MAKYSDIAEILYQSGEVPRPVKQSSLIISST